MQYPKIKIRNESYKKWKTVGKGVVVLLIALGAGFLGDLDVTIDSLPDSVEGLTLPLVLGFLAALVRVVENYRKNSTQGTDPAWEWPWSRFLGMLVVVLCLSGCVGLGQSGTLPWRSDAMTYEVDFENIQAGELDAEGNPTEGESIKYTCKVKGKPGDVIAMVAQMGIEVDGPDKWSINIAQEGQMDSTAQAAMLNNLGLAEYELVAKVSADVVRAAIEAVLPGYLADVEAGVARKQIDAETIRLIAGEVSSLLGSRVSP